MLYNFSSRYLVTAGTAYLSEVNILVPMIMATGDSIEGESQPLLPGREDVGGESAAGEAITPLPKVQIAVLLLISLAEPLTSQVIYPFINQACASNLMG